MATIDFAARAVYNTYCDGAVYTTNPRRIGYSNTSGTNKYVTVYKFTMPVVDGTITSITLNPYISSAGYAVAANKTWQVGIAYCGTSSAPTSSTSENFASAIKGVGSTVLTYRTTFTNGSSTMTASDTTTQINCGAKTIAVNTASDNWNIPFSTSSSTQYLYLAVYSAKTSEANICKISSLTGYITYTRNTYTIKPSSCIYSTASVTPTSGYNDTTFTISGSTFANSDDYIYGNLKFYYGNYGYESCVKTVSGYASGHGKSLSGTFSNTFGKYNLYYHTEATCYSANPGWVNNCTVSNITTSSAKVTVPTSGITTTFLNSYYYITATDSGNVASSITGSTSFARSTGYVNVTGLTSGTTNNRYIYAYNSYNNRYYKISTVSIKTSAASYSADITVNVKGKSSTSLTIDNLSSTSNLNSDWYLSTENSTTATSLSSPNAATRSNSITLLGLSSDTSYTYYGYVYNTVDKKYYQVGSVSFTTDADYTGDLFVDVTGSTSATITISNLNSEANLSNNIYITNNNVSPTTAVITSGSLYNGVNMTGFTENTSYTYDAYVYSSASGTYYKIGSVTFTTEPESYTDIGKVAITGITASDAHMCCFGMKNNTNMSDLYIMTFDNCGDNVSTVTNPIVAEDTIGQSHLYTDLIGGMPYTVYFYVKNTRTDTYRLVGSVDFNAYSSVFNLGGKRVRAVRCDENGVLSGCVIYLNENLINAPQGGNS